jgi:hypothetical protein
MFNDLHLHLLINHAPVVGMLLASLLLLLALFTTSRTLHLVALGLVLFAGLTGVAANLTGEPAAEQVVEHIDDDLTLSYIHSHEEMGEKSYYACIALGVIALAGFIFTLRRETGSRFLAAVLLLLTAGANVMLAITASLGGSISHPGIRDDGFSRQVESRFMESDEELEGEEEMEGEQ